MTNRTLFAVGAHADDHESPIGGTLLKYHDLGYKIAYVLSTNNFSGNWSKLQPDGRITHDPCPHWKIEPQRKLEAARAAAELGTVPIHLDHPQRHYFNDEGKQVEVRYGCELPKGLPANIPTILTAYEDKASVQKLADLILEHNPEAVLTHSPIMVNIEHWATCMLVTNAYWKAVQKGFEGMLLHWYDISVGPFGEAYVKWDTFVDVSKYWKRKFELMGIHACQIPVPANMELPELGSACGCEHAEAFWIVSSGKRPVQGTPFNFEILGNRR